MHIRKPQIARLKVWFTALLRAEATVHKLYIGHRSGRARKYTPIGEPWEWQDVEAIGDPVEILTELLDELPGLGNYELRVDAIEDGTVYQPASDELGGVGPTRRFTVVDDADNTPGKGGKGDSASAAAVRDLAKEFSRSHSEQGRALSELRSQLGDAYREANREQVALFRELLSNTDTYHRETTRLELEQIRTESAHQIELMRLELENDWRNVLLQGVIEAGALPVLIGLLTEAAVAITGRILGDGRSDDDDDDDDPKGTERQERQRPPGYIRGIMRERAPGGNECRPYTVECPYCGAPPRRKCENNSGFLRRAHADRRKATVILDATAEEKD